MRQCASYINARRHRFPDLAGWRTTRLRSPMHPGCAQVCCCTSETDALSSLYITISTSGSQRQSALHFHSKLSSQCERSRPYPHGHAGTSSFLQRVIRYTDGARSARNAASGRWMMIQVTASGIPSNLTRSQPPGSLAGYQRIPAGTTGLGTAGLIPRLDRATNLGTARSCHIAFEMMSRHA